MSYDPEELRVGILESFVDVARRGKYRTDFGELPSAFFRITAAKLAPPPKRERLDPKVIWRRAVDALVVGGYGVCTHCGARSSAHRCPVYVVGVST